MRIYFIIPPEKGIVEKPTSPHLGIAYLASVLREKKHHVGLIDMRLGYKTENMLNKVKEFNPDMVCITAVTMGYKEVYNVINMLKNKGYKVVVGGPHVSSFRKKVLEDTKADFAVKREGEETIVRICEDDKYETIKGLIWRKGNEIIENEDRPFETGLDNLSFPAFDLFELNKYMDKKLPIITSRGCPYNCTFCSIKLTSGSRFRPRSPESVVKELEHWYKLKYYRFVFNDDNFTLIPERVEKICDLIIEKGLKIKWELRNGIRIDRVNEKLLTKMKKAGCAYVAYGVESIDKEVLERMKKGITPEQVREAIKITDKVGIKKGAFFIVGLPGDDYKKFMKTLNFALSLNLDEMRFYNAIPYPGTELYNWVEKNGRWLIKPEVYLNSIGGFDDQPVYETDDFTKAERVKATKIANSYMMKYIMKREFGKILGSLGWYVWKPKPTRKYIFKVGIKVWTYLRKIKSKFE